MPNISSFGAQTDNAVVSGTVTDRQMIIPEVPPQGLMSVGPRVTPNFVKPREWNDKTTYHFFDAVRDNAGNAYVATKPVVPEGTPLSDENYWFLWADPDTRFDDLNETVKTFNQRITQNTVAIASKAPMNHASEESVYGVGNAINYGHVQLATSDTPLNSDANSGIAVTPKFIPHAVSAHLSCDAPENYGAIGDGVSDDTNAVQQALNSNTPNVIFNKHYKVTTVTCSNKKNIYGAGTIAGTVYLGNTDSIVTGINVSDITIKGNVILNNYRASRISNVKFISTGYCITRNESLQIKKHHIGYFEITNCEIKSDKGFIKLIKKETDEDLPFNDISIFECTSNTINDEFFYSDIQDGIKIYNNKIQYKSFGAAQKGSAIVINQGDFISIVGNTIFETGKSPIILNLCNNTIISNNNIGWCGQQEICPAMSINKKQSLIPTHIIISNNSITYQSGYAIDVESCRFVNIDSNTIKWNENPPYLKKPGCIQTMDGAKGGITYNQLLYSAINGNTLEGGSILAPNANNSQRVLLSANSGNTNNISTTSIMGSTSTSSNLNVATSNVIILNPDAPFSITQLNTFNDGQLVYIFNDSEHTITLTNNHLLHLKDGANVQLTKKTGLILVSYNGVAYQIA